MANNRATNCNAVLSPLGPHHVTITVLFAKATGEAVGWRKYGKYPAHLEHLAGDIADWMCQFLNDTGRTQGFITPEDASVAYANGHDHVMRQLGGVPSEEDAVVRGRGCATFGGEE